MNIDTAIPGRRSILSVLLTFDSTEFPSRRASAASMVDVAHAAIAEHVNVIGRRSGSPTRNAPVRGETPNGVGSIADAGAHGTAHVSRRSIGSKCRPTSLTLAERQNSSCSIVQDSGARSNRHRRNVAGNLAH